MTASDSATPLPSSLVAAADAAPRGIDALLDRWSERFNPILVKEARQSLKSYQFAISFFLVLACAWVWSFLGVMAASPGIYFAAGGPLMLSGYVWILGFPLVVVIPFMAFYSLAWERDDGTHELVAITTLRPGQIIAGRISSAVLQMFVYLSVLSPCFAFTYLLRGVDLVLIGLLLFYAAGLSLLLTSFALLLASLGRSRLLSLLLAMMLLIGLLVLYFAMCNVAGFQLTWGASFDYASFRFWIDNAAIVSFGLSAFVLFCTAASMQLTFVSQNRSTPLRLVMLAQQALAIGWCAWYLLGAHEIGAFMLPVVLAPFYWGLMGSLMIGESPELHQRARRRLPQSFLGRVLLTWLCPGPGTGYVFTLANMTGLAAVLLLCEHLARMQSDDWWFPHRVGADEHSFWLLLAEVCYVAIYLGIARLLVIVLRRVVPVTPPAGLALTVLVFLVGTLAPMVVHSSLMFSNQYNMYQRGYSLLLLPVPFITIEEIVQRGVWNDVLLGMPLIPGLLAGFAGLIVLVNLGFAGREVRRLRESAPERVLADDAARRPVPPKAKDPLEE
jgi:hypothetical protein